MLDETGDRIVCPYNDQPIHLDEFAILLLPVDDGGQAIDGTAIVVKANEYAYASE